jgi:magnesium chelatase family protein
MLARVRSGALMGIDAVVVECEVDMALGLPFFNVVGLPEGAVRESKVRVVSALKNCGYELPQKRVTVNLAPADIRKEGAAFELPIALGVLAAARLLAEAPLARYLFAGELSLDGWVKPIRGVLPLALAARDGGFSGIMVPRANAAEAALVDKVDVIPVRNLREAVDHLNGVAPLAPYDRAAVERPAPADGQAPDMSEVMGQPDLKDALEVAAAGGHNVLMSGPPGSGKTMLARRLPGILPAMTFPEALEVTKIASVLGMLPEGAGLVDQRPFRAPHHTISDAGLVGGGSAIRPGELSMAHHGVLFLDELPEFRKNVLEVLRQPLEEGTIHLARANHHVTYPCRVMMVAAMNPCPCGWNGVPGHACECPLYRVLEYRSRVSGPLMDRIDMTLQTRAVSPDKLRRQRESEERPSAYFRARVEEARERQRHRFRETPLVHCNAQMTPRQVRRHCAISPRAEALLENAMRRYGLSARAHDRILRLARTRADLEGAPDVRDDDVQLAIDYRMLDRKGFMYPGGADAERPAPPPRSDAPPSP